MPKTLVVIISYNAKRYTIECIESVREKLVPDTYKIVVVDNASTDGIREWLSEQKDILLIKSETNIGFGPACNLAVHSTVGTEYENYDVFLLNSDTHLTSTALPKMQQALYENENIGAVGATANYAGNRQQIDVSFDDVSDYIKYGESLVISEVDAHMERVRLNGFAMLIRRSLWDSIGGFDEDFAPGYYEDDALSIEILKRGFRLIWVRDAFIYHAGSASFVKTGKNTLSLEHHQLFIRKYSFDILKFVYPCGAVISQIPFGRSDCFKLLYLGCGLGAELKAIRSFFRDADIYGIEKDPVLYDIVSKTENVFTSISELKEHISVELSIDCVCNEKGSKIFDLLIVDSVFLEGLSEDEKAEITALCKDSAVEINRLHDYDDYPFDNVKLILWDKKDYNEKTATLLSRWGIMSSIYSCDNLKKRINSYGIGPENMLLISSENIFRANSFILCPDLPSADTNIVPYLTAHYSRLPATDPSCLNAHKLYQFEHRMALMEKACSKEEFLSDSQIQITINRDCFTKIKEIQSLLQECYLMDYVKADYDLARLERLVTNSWNDCGYITCKDKDKDYGLVGFYCINKRENKVLAFSFSWTVTGLGIENYVYNKLGAPAITPKDSRSPELFSGFATPWISENRQSAILIDKRKSSRINILIKGTPSLHPIEDYLIGGNVTTEYEGENSTCALPTKLFTDAFHIIIYSFLQYDFDVWEKNSEAMLAELFGKLEQLSGNTPGNPTIILLLGCEKSFDELSAKDKKLSELYKELNPIISSFASDQVNFRTINITDLIKSSSDFKGSINDFSVRVYSDIVEQIVVYINEKIDELLAR